MLFFVQSLLIGTRNRRFHFTLGWSAVPIALAIATTGTWVAIRSVEITPPEFQFGGLRYSQFLLVMLTEVASYTIFITVGVMTRKKPKVHRTAMMMASLSLLAGATVRMPFLHPLFGATGWVGLFGPVFCIGAALVVIRCALTRSLDRWFTVAYVIWVIVFITSVNIALTEMWRNASEAILKL